MQIKLSLACCLLIVLFAMNLHAATAMVKDLKRGPESSNPAQLTNCRGIVFFIIGEDQTAELWKTNGNAAGTIRIKKLYPGWTRPQHLTCAGGQLFFTAYNASRYVTQLMRSDGTTSGTRPVIALSGDTNLYSLKGQIFFVQSRATGLELWKSNGTGSGTQRVAVLAQSGYSNLSDPAGVKNGILYFVVDESTHGRELWKSDGTEEGTQIVPGAPSSPYYFAFLGNRLYFFVILPDAGHQLWTSDGTAEGTFFVKSFGNDEPTFLIAAGSKLFFHMETRDHFTILNDTLWESDGSTAGTFPVKDHVMISDFPTAVGESIFFPTVFGTQLWKSDGTSPGTRLIKKQFCYDVSWIRNINGSVVFAADDCHHGSELWRSDGAAKGTFLLRDIRPGRAESAPSNLVRYHNVILFAADDGVHGNELWISDGR